VDKLDRFEEGGLRVKPDITGDAEIDMVSLP
jgi:hypothetical protein